METKDRRWYDSHLETSRTIKLLVTKQAITIMKETELWGYISHQTADAGMTKLIASGLL